MIISHRHQFIFFQVEQTGSSYLGRFFVEHFDGQPMLRKHTSVLEFLKTANQQEKKYRRIIGKRNPLDRATTRFVRNNMQDIEQARSHEEVQMLFEKWFHKIFNSSKQRRLRASYHVPESYPYVDDTIRQEKLADDLAAVLKELNLFLESVPQWETRTRGKLPDFTTYYADSLKPIACEILKEEMELLGYEIPLDWRAIVVSK